MRRIAIGSLPLIVLLVLVSLTLALWWEHDTQHEALLKGQTQTAAAIMSDQLRTFMHNRLSTVRLLADTIAAGPPQKIGQLYADNAALTFNTYPGFAAINLADTGGVIRQIYPVASNEEALHKNLREHRLPEVRAAVERALTGQTSSSPVLELYQGRLGFAVYQPIYRRGNVLGLVNAVFRLDTLLPAAMGEALAQDFNVRVLENGKPVFTTATPVARGAEGFVVGRELGPYAGGTWKLEVRPGEAMRRTRYPTASPLLLVMGLVLSVVIASLVSLLSRSVRAESEAAQQLRVEVQRRTALLNELNHRVRNNLSAVLGLLHHARANTLAPATAIEGAMERLRTLGHVQNMLSSSDWKHIPLATLLENVCRMAIRRHGSTVELHIDPAAAEIPIGPEKANALALVIQSLAEQALASQPPGAPLVIGPVWRVDHSLNVGFPLPSGQTPGPAEGVPPEIQGLIRHELGGRLSIKTTGGHDLLCLSMRLDSDWTSQI